MTGIMEIAAFIVAVIIIATLVALLIAGGDWIINKILRWLESRNPTQGGKL